MSPLCLVAVLVEHPGLPADRALEVAQIEAEINAIEAEINAIEAEIAAENGAPIEAVRAWLAEQEAS